MTAFNNSSFLSYFFCLQALAQFSSRKNLFGNRHEVFFLNLEDGYFGCQVNESVEFLQIYELSRLCDGLQDCYMGSDENRKELKCSSKFLRFLSCNCITVALIFINYYNFLLMLLPSHQTTVLVKMVRVVQTVLASTINVIVMMASEDVTASFPTKMNVNTDHAISLRIARTR